MQIKLGKYLIDIKRSYVNSPDKQEGPIDNKPPDTDNVSENTSKTPAGTVSATASSDKSFGKSDMACADTSALTTAKPLPGSNSGDINTIEFVSHELKGVLGSTILCVYSIRDGLLGMLNFKQRASVETTIRNLRRLESTIKDFLDISRLEDGQLKIRKTSINVSEDIINEVEDAFLTEIYENRVVFENRIPKDLVIVSDRTLLMTIFNNLVSNAIKYGARGGNIIVSTQGEKGSLISFSVYNDGIPIVTEDKEKLFRKFSRLEKEHDKKIKGTGLGLFIIKDIIENLGGSIRVETSDKGNEFIFEIERV